MLAYLFVIVAIALRFVLRPLAFAPVGPALLYFGARAPREHAWFPLALLVVADVGLTRMVYGYPFTIDHVSTWLWYAAVLWLGTWLREARPLRIAGAALATSVSFFLVSNFAVWAVWNMYPRTMGGLAACYVAALPFFRNQLVSDMISTAVMFGLGALLSRRADKRALANG